MLTCALSLNAHLGKEGLADNQGQIGPGHCQYLPSSKAITAQTCSDLWAPLLYPHLPTPPPRGGGNT